MKIVEIAPLENGAHRNQNGNLSVVPEGWAVIRGNEELENFPFGSFEVEYVDGTPYLKEGSWTPGEIPEPEPEPIPEPTEMEQLRADVDFIAMEMGVEL